MPLTEKTAAKHEEVRNSFKWSDIEIKINQQINKLEV